MDLGDARLCKKIASNVLKKYFEANQVIEREHNREYVSDDLSLIWGIHPQGDGRYGFALRASCKSKVPSFLLEDLEKELSLPSYDFSYEEIGEFEFASGETLVRPLVLGLPIGQPRDQEGSGTIGMFVRSIEKPDEMLILSCAHVLASPSNAEDQSILQPSLSRGGKYTDPYCIARLREYKYPSILHDNYMDAAVATLKPGFESPHPRMISETEFITGVADASDIGDFVKKYGGVTNCTEGKIDTFEADGYVDINSQRYYFIDQILVQSSGKYSSFLERGDSGSVLLDGQNQVVGLLFARTTAGKGLASSITHIFEQLQIELA